MRRARNCGASRSSLPRRARCSWRWHRRPIQGVVGRCALSVDVVLEPAKEVGGDLVDYFCIGDDLLVLVLGDVSDKGAGAALMMASTHALFRGIVARPDAPRLFRAPEETVRLVNATLAVGNSSCMFVTLLIAAFDAATSRLTYVRGRSRAAVLATSRRRGRAADCRGRPAAWTDGGRRAHIRGRRSCAGRRTSDRHRRHHRGHGPVARLFGEARVAELLGQSDLHAGALLDQLLAQVRGFEAGSPQSDDIAAILLRRADG